MRVCPVPGCPTLTTGGRCSIHASEQDKARGSRQQRGYDAEHDRLRRVWAKRIASAPVTCARGCGTTLTTGDDWHLDHTDDRTAYLGPSCAPCNLAAGGRAAHA